MERAPPRPRAQLAPLPLPVWRRAGHAALPALPAPGGPCPHAARWVAVDVQVMSVPCRAVTTATGGLPVLYDIFSPGPRSLSFSGL